MVGIFLIWRLSRAWDLDEEKVLDVTLLTFLGGLLGARIYFVVENLRIFSADFLRIILVNKYPGFSFWGAFLGGWLTLFFLARARKENFWLLSDIGSIGFLAGLILADLGCFLGGCQVGIKSNSFLAVQMVGFLGKRFPTSLIEALILTIVLFKLWSKTIHFHLRGKILSLSLIYIGMVKFLLAPLKQRSNSTQFLSFSLVLLGVFIFYKISKRNIISDLKNIPNNIYRSISDPVSRKSALLRWQKYWYNQKTSIWWKLKNLKRS